MRKNTIQEIIDSFSNDDDVDVEAFLEKLTLRERIEEAEEQFAAGMEIPHPEIENEFKKWLK